jgi:DNA helicase-2/ATP-dependent DNA helicase PcrA
MDSEVRARLVDDLNDAQREAVTIDTRALRVVAGAGSGKTRVLTRRIAHRVDANGIDPRRVVAVTFTRKAAQELRNRLQHLGLRNDVQAGTFHSLAFAQLRQRWSERGVNPPALLDRKVGFVARIMRTQSTATVIDIVQEIEWAKARMIPAGEYPEAASRAHRSTGSHPEKIQSVYAAYEQEKLRKRMIDFDDILRLATRDIESDEQYRTARQWMFRHFFVDEFQDVNPLQFRLLNAWCGPSSDICAVGDPHQAIYTWNGADSSFLTGFTDHFPDAMTVTLADNYRSTPQILKTANALLATRGLGGFDLISHRGDGPAPEVSVHQDDQAEATAIARRIRSHRGRGSAWADHAVLVRTQAQLVALQSTLEQSGIPTTTRVAGAFTAQPEIKAAFTMMRRSSGFDVALADLEHDLASPDASSVAHDLSPDRRSNLEQLLHLGLEYRTLVSQATVPDFFAWLSATLTESHRGDRDAVTIETFHGSKGLEWPIVHIAGCEDGLIPIHHAKDSAAQTEETRLFYVAITRAQNHLYLSWARLRTFGSKQVPRTSSPLLEDIDLARSFISQASTPATRRARSPQRNQSKRPMDPPLVHALKNWRRDYAKGRGVPAYIVLTDATLTEIAERRPTTASELLEISGIGVTKLEAYGSMLIDIIQRTPADEPAVTPKIVHDRTQ